MLNFSSPALPLSLPPAALANAVNVDPNDPNGANDASCFRGQRVGKLLTLSAFAN